MGKVKKCAICGKPIVGYGNNAEPLRKGYCCDSCNEKAVMPMRMAFMKCKMANA